MCERAREIERESDKGRGREGGRRRERERRREAEREFHSIYFSTVKVIVHRTTYKFANATVVLVIKAFIVKSEYSNSNTKTLFYKDCSLGSIKNLSNN